MEQKFPAAKTINERKNANLDHRVSLMQPGIPVFYIICFLQSLILLSLLKQASFFNKVKLK